MSKSDQSTGGNFSFSPYVSEVKGELQKTDPQEQLEVIEAKLPGLSDTNANEPGEGYRNFELLSETHPTRQLVEHSHSSESDILHFEYIYEKTENVKSIHKGNLVNVERLTAEFVDIYWFGDIMLFSGQSESTSKAKNRLQSELVGELRLEKVSFPTEILNGILEDKFSNEFINEENPEIIDIRSLTAKGNENVSQVSIHGGQGLQTYKKYLEDTSKITQMIATFEYIDYSILASISEPTIHIYSISSSEKLENKEKLLISILFSTAFIRTFRSSYPR